MDLILNIIENIFVFNPEKPYIFTRFEFWGFFAVVLIIYCIVYKRIGLRNAFLFIASLFFYYKTSGLYFFLLVFSTIIDYFIGKQIYKSKTKNIKKILVALSVIINLSLLSYFKYSYLLIDSLNYIFHTNFEVIDILAKWTNDFAGSNFSIDRIILPVGISFFTFQTISYSIDMYRGHIKPVKNIIDFGFYVSFFPQLVAGPIVRASEFVPQLYKDFKLTKQEFGIALFLILNGLAKKMLVSDYISINFVDRVFSNPIMYTGIENLMSLYGYSIQVYCDFSGYTDIAIGVALLLGFRLPTNFNSPYKALSVAEFWKRWHISLSTWLKDYLYIPIGGNRSGSFFSYLMLFILAITVVIITKYVWLFGVFALIAVALILISKNDSNVAKNLNTNINLMLTMLIGGLWHGASWQFVIWGGLNGLGLVVYRYWKRISPFADSRSFPVKIYSVLLTFNFLTFTRIWFRSESMEGANSIMYQIANAFDISKIGDIFTAYWKVFGIMIFAMIIHWLPTSFKNKYKNWFVKCPIWAKISIVVVLVFLIYQMKSTDIQPFIYFDF